MLQVTGAMQVRGNESDQFSSDWPRRKMGSFTYFTIFEKQKMVK
jgi:hypothetical protein